MYKWYYTFCSGISVGLPVESSPDDVARASMESKADVIVVEGEAVLKKVLLVQHKLTDLRAIVQLRGEPPLSDKRRLHRTHKVGSMTAVFERIFAFVLLVNGSIEVIREG